MNKTIAKSITNMRANECEVYLHHIRRLTSEKDKDGKPVVYPRGGMTRISVRIPPKVIDSSATYDKPIEVSGECRCSNSDIFCRDTGANKAFARMMKNLHNVVGRATILKLVKTTPVEQVEKAGA